MHTLRLRMRTSFSALVLVASIAALLAPLTAVQNAAAEQIDVMAIDQVYVRSEATTSSTIIGELQEGDWVTTTGYEENGFVEVWYGDWVGYVYADYLDYSPSTSSESSSSSDSYWVDAGWLYTADSVNLRSGPGTGEGIVTTVPAGTSIYRTGLITNGFAEVESDYGSGWIHTDYLTWDEPVTETATATSGSAMVDFAMQYLGYPYVWAGNTPSGFDCSGFTQYVTQNVLGYDITHSTDIQATYGTSVAWGEWQPGDLVFFVGTGGSGYISHVGIYIGDGQFIHAENPSTGVVISSLYSDYYSNHYYSSTRLGE
ncbi:MAG: C40 family peptidase [Thermomicrobiales bacterium]|nr:C40 family peptidase [Thermomicrobiales bacterium]